MNQYVVLEVDEAESEISRDTIMKILHAENVVARRYFYPGCHRMEPYCSFFPHAKMLLPNTEQVVRKVLTLPTGTTVSRETVRKVCDLIRFSIANGQELTRKLPLA